jgi:hypothetical protein
VALLPTLDRDRVAIAFSRFVVGQMFSFDKATLRAAIDTTDQWVEDNTASFNTSLPVAFRTSATAVQKTILLAYVLWRRIGRLTVAEDG